MNTLRLDASSSSIVDGYIDKADKLVCPLIIEASHFNLFQRIVTAVACDVRNLDPNEPNAISYVYRLDHFQAVYVQDGGGMVPTPDVLYSGVMYLHPEEIV